MRILVLNSKKRFRKTQKNMYPSEYSRIQIKAPAAGFKKMFESVDSSCKRKQLRSFRPASAFGKDRDHCLCKVLRPIIFLWQITGILPVSHDRKSCKMTHKWFSILAFHNLFWVILNMFLVKVGINTMRNVFISELQGIDIYAFSIVIGVQFTATILIFLAGNFSAPQFLKAWTELHAVTEEVELPNFRRTKRLIYILPAYLSQEIFAAMIIFISLKLTGALEVKDVSFAAHFSTLTANAIPNLTSGIYAVFLTIIRQNFKTINKRLQGILQKESTVGNIGKHWNPLLHVQVARFRILHEKLCHAVRSLESAFGLQILAIFLGTCISFIAGVYSIIIGSQGLATPRMNSMMIVFGFGTIAATGRVVIVTWACQNVMNESSGTSHILNNLESDAYSEDVNAEVAKFLLKIGNFPLQTKCYNIFQLGNGFYASACSAVVTYVLILIQFRMDDE